LIDKIEQVCEAKYSNMNAAEAETIADLVQNMIKSFFGEQKPG